jgi:hypothetical protein
LSDTWFSKLPLGKHGIGSIAKNMILAASIQDKITNHSARKTGIKTLLHADFAPTEVMQLSGHRNVQSLNAYSSLSLEQQRSMSNEIASNMPPLQEIPQQSDPSHNSTAVPAVASPTSDHAHSTIILADKLADLIDIPASRPNTSLPISATPTSTPCSFFCGATINGNINIHIHDSSKNTPCRKRKRILYISDSEE